jgi:hypothetical protein
VENAKKELVMIKRIFSGTTKRKINLLTVCFKVPFIIVSSSFLKFGIFAVWHYIFYSTFKISFVHNVKK